MGNERFGAGGAVSGKAAAGRFGFTARAVALACVLLLVVNLALGYALVSQSMAVIKSLINERMLDVSNTAAAMIDGDAYEALSAEDEGTEAYQAVYDTLAIFRDNIDLEYVYGVRAVGEREFVFTIDPSFGTPGAFGQEIGYTDALYAASKGEPAVDEVPYEDEWGRFYSAYSPIFNSAGDVVGMVSVDFSAQWYEDQLATHARTALFIGGMSLLVGALVVLLIMSRYRKRFRMLYQQLTELAADVESLTLEVAPRAAARNGADMQREGVAANGSNGAEDDIDALGQKIRAMQGELRESIARVRDQAYTDALTGVGSMTSYTEAVGAYNEGIAGGDAAFSVAVFDINGLKETNDSFGHERGDELIIAAVGAITKVFAADCAYRIGGDEFVVLLDGLGADEVAGKFSEFDDVLTDVNRAPERAGLPVSVSKGAATYRPGEDAGFRDVLRRADQEMYHDKAAYYATHGDRRHVRDRI